MAVCESVVTIQWNLSGVQHINQRHLLLLQVLFYIYFSLFLSFFKNCNRVEKENSSMALRFLPALTMMRLSSRPVMRVQVRLETCVASL